MPVNLNELFPAASTTTLSGATNPTPNVDWGTDINKGNWRTLFNRADVLDDMAQLYGQLHGKQFANTKEVQDYFITDMTRGNLNTVGAIKDAIAANRMTDPQAKMFSRMLRLYETADFMGDPEYGGAKHFFGNILPSVLLDPVNLIGGAFGKAAGQSVVRGLVQAGKEVGKDVVWQGIKTGAKEGAIKEGIANAAASTVTDAALQARDIELGQQNGYSISRGLGAAAEGGVMGGVLGGFFGGGLGGYGAATERGKFNRMEGIYDTGGSLGPKFSQYDPNNPVPPGGAGGAGATVDYTSINPLFTNSNISLTNAKLAGITGKLDDEISKLADSFAPPNALRPGEVAADPKLQPKLDLLNESRANLNLLKDAPEYIQARIKDAEAARLAGNEADAISHQSRADAASRYYTKLMQSTEPADKIAADYAAELARLGDERLAAIEAQKASKTQGGTGFAPAAGAATPSATPAATAAAKTPGADPLAGGAPGAPGADVTVLPDGTLSVPAGTPDGAQVRSIVDPAAAAAAGAPAKNTSLDLNDFLSGAFNPQEGAAGTAGTKAATTPTDVKTGVADTKPAANAPDGAMSIEDLMAAGDAAPKTGGEPPAPAADANGIQSKTGKSSKEEIEALAQDMQKQQAQIPEDLAKLMAAIERVKTDPSAGSQEALIASVRDMIRTGFEKATPAEQNSMIERLVGLFGPDVKEGMSSRKAISDAFDDVARSGDAGVARAEAMTALSRMGMDESRAAQEVNRWYTLARSSGKDVGEIMAAVVEAHRVNLTAHDIVQSIQPIMGNFQGSRSLFRKMMELMDVSPQYMDDAMAVFDVRMVTTRNDEFNKILSKSGSFSEKLEAIQAQMGVDALEASKNVNFMRLQEAFKDAPNEIADLVRVIQAEADRYGRTMLRYAKDGGLDETARKEIVAQYRSELIKKAIADKAAGRKFTPDVGGNGIINLEDAIVGPALNPESGQIETAVLTGLRPLKGRLVERDGKFVFEPGLNGTVYILAKHAMENAVKTANSHGYFGKVSKFDSPISRKYPWLSKYAAQIHAAFMGNLPKNAREVGTLYSPESEGARKLMSLPSTRTTEYRARLGDFSAKEVEKGIDYSKFADFDEIKSRWEPGDGGVELFLESVAMENRRVHGKAFFVDPITNQRYLDWENMSMTTADGVTRRPAAPGSQSDEALGGMTARVGPTLDQQKYNINQSFAGQISTHATEASQASAVLDKLAKMRSKKDLYELALQHTELPISRDGKKFRWDGAGDWPADAAVKSEISRVLVAKRDAARAEIAKLKKQTNEALAQAEAAAAKAQAETGVSPNQTLVSGGTYKQSSNALFIEPLTGLAFADAAKANAIHIAAKQQIFRDSVFRIVLEERVGRLQDAGVNVSNFDNFTQRMVDAATPADKRIDVGDRFSRLAAGKVSPISYERMKGQLAEVMRLHNTTANEISVALGDAYRVLDEAMRITNDSEAVARLVEKGAVNGEAGLKTAAEHIKQAAGKAATTSDTPNVYLYNGYEVRGTDFKIEPSGTVRFAGQRIGSIAKNADGTVTFSRLDGDTGVQVKTVHSDPTSVFLAATEASGKIIDRMGAAGKLTKSNSSPKPIASMSSDSLSNLKDRIAGVSSIDPLDPQLWVKGKDLSPAELGIPDTHKLAIRFPTFVSDAMAEKGTFLVRAEGDNNFANGTRQTPAQMAGSSKVYGQQLDAAKWEIGTVPVGATSNTQYASKTFRRLGETPYSDVKPGVSVKKAMPAKVMSEAKAATTALDETGIVTATGSKLSPSGTDYSQYTLFQVHRALNGIMQISWDKIGTAAQLDAVIAESKFLTDIIKHYAPDGIQANNTTRRRGLQMLHDTFSTFSREEQDTAQIILRRLGGEFSPEFIPGSESMRSEGVAGALFGVNGEVRPDKAQFNPYDRQAIAVTDLPIGNRDPGSMSPVLTLIHELGHWGYFNTLTPSERVEWLSMIRREMYDADGTLNTTKIQDYTYYQATGSGSNALASPQELFANQMVSFVAAKMNIPGFEHVVRTAAEGLNSAITRTGAEQMAGQSKTFIQQAQEIIRGFIAKINGVVERLFGKHHDDKLVDGAGVLYSKIFPDEMPNGASFITRTEDGFFAPGIQPTVLFFDKMARMRQQLSDAISTGSADSLRSMLFHGGDAGDGPVRNFLYGIYKSVNRDYAQFVKEHGEGNFLEHAYKAMHVGEGKEGKVKWSEFVRQWNDDTNKFLEQFAVDPKFSRGLEESAIADMANEHVTSFDALADAFNAAASPNEMAQLGGLAVRALAALDAFSEKLASHIESQTSVAMQREGVNIKKSRGYKDIVEDRQKVKKAREQRAALEAKAAADIAEAGSTTVPGSAAEAGASAQARAAKTMTMPEMLAELRNPELNPESKRADALAKEIGSRFQRQAAAIPRPAAAGDDLMKELHQLGNKKLANRLVEAMKSGDSVVAQAAAHMLGARAQRALAAGEDFKYLAMKSGSTLNAMRREMLDSVGAPEFVSIPANATPQVTEWLVRMTHRDPVAQTSMRSIGNRLMTMMDMTERDMTGASQDIGQFVNERLSGVRASKTSNVGLDVSSESFMALRKDMRRLAANLQVGGDADVAVNIASRLLYRGVIDESSQKVVAQAFAEAARRGTTKMENAEDFFVNGVQSWLAGERPLALAWGTNSGAARLANIGQDVAEKLGYMFSGNHANPDFSRKYFYLAAYGDVFSQMRPETSAIGLSRQMYGENVTHPMFARKYVEESLVNMTPEQRAAALDFINAPQSKIIDLKDHIFVTLDGPQTFPRLDGQYGPGIYLAHYKKAGLAATKTAEDIMRALRAGDHATSGAVESAVHVLDEQTLKMMQHADSTPAAIAENMMTEGLANKVISGRTAEQFNRTTPVFVSTGQIFDASSPGLYDGMVASFGKGGKNALYESLVGRGYDSIRVVERLDDGSMVEKLVVFDESRVRPLNDPQFLKERQPNLMAERELENGKPVPKLLGAMMGGEDIGAGIQSAVGSGGATADVAAFLRKIARREATSESDVSRIADFKALQLRTNSSRLRQDGARWFADYISPKDGVGFFEQHNSEFGKIVYPLIDALHTLEDASSGFKRWVGNLKPLATLGHTGPALPKSYTRIADAIRMGSYSNLAEAERNVAFKIRDEFNNIWKKLTDSGVLVGDAKRYGGDYFPQVWDVELIKKDVDKFRNSLADFFMEDPTFSTGKMTPEAVRADALRRADGVIMRLDNDAGVTLPYDAAFADGGDHFMRRVLAMNPEQMQRLGMNKYLVNDIEGIIVKYYDSAVRRLILHEKFGTNAHGLTAYRYIAHGGRDALVDVLMKNVTEENKQFLRNTDLEREVTSITKTQVVGMPEAQARAVAQQLEYIFTSAGRGNEDAARGTAKAYLEKVYGRPDESGDWARRSDAIVAALSDFGFNGKTMSRSEMDFMANMYAAMSHSPGTQNYPELLKKTSKTLRNFNAVTLLSMSTLASIPDFILPLVRSGDMASFLKGVSSWFNVDDRYRQAVRNLGVSMENLVHDRLAQLDGQASSRFTNAFFQLNLLTPWTAMNRELAALTGFHMLQAEQRIAHAAYANGNIQTRAFRKADRILRHFGLEDFLEPGAPMLDNIEKAMEQDKVRMALIRFANESVFSPNKNDIPLWAQSPLGAIAWQLKSYPMMMGRLAKHVLSEAKQGNVMPLTYLTTVAAGFGMGSLAIRDYIQSRGGEDEKSRALRDRSMTKILKEFGIDQPTALMMNKDLDKFLGWYVESMVSVIGIGLLGDMLFNSAQKLDNGAYGTVRVLSGVFGPSVSTLVEGQQVLSGFAEALSDDPGNGDRRQAVRNVSGRVPVIGSNRDFRESTTDLIAGEARKVSNAPVTKMHGIKMKGLELKGAWGRGANVWKEGDSGENMIVGTPDVGN